MDDGKLLTVPQAGLLDTILSLAFPVRCAHCGRPGGLLCADCAAQLKPVTTCCRKCGAPGPDRDSCHECRGRDLPFTSARAAFRFEGPARSLVHALKYSGQRRIARFMADLAVQVMPAAQAPPRRLTPPTSGDRLTYVPLHQSKLLTRGYNQAALYAQAVSRRLELPLEDILVKHRPTPAQNQLNFSERRNNLSESFSLRRGAPATGRRIILVDDVYTTGSTTAECAGLLERELGAEVEVWTFARTAKRA